MLMGVTILTVIRFILQASMNMSEDLMAYSVSEIKILAKSPKVAREGEKRNTKRVYNKT